MAKCFRSLIIALALAVGLLHLPAMAATYYVDSAAGNDSNPGTATSAWRTIGKAANTMVAGDKVIVKKGTYLETINPANSGTSAARITYQANSGDLVIVDCAGTRENGVSFSGVNYVRIEGFDIRNCTGSTIFQNSSSAGTGLEIVNNKIHDNRGGTSSAGVYYRYAKNGLIEGNEIYSNQGDGITAYSSQGLTIRNNHIHHNGVDGIKPSCDATGSVGKTLLIEGNHIEFQESDQSHGDGVQLMTCTATIVIRGNKWNDNTQNIYLDTYHPTPGCCTWGNAYIYNNVVYQETDLDGYHTPDTHANGIVIDLIGNNISNVSVYSNTLVSQNAGSAGFRTLGSYRITGKLSIRNNLFYNSVSNWNDTGAAVDEVDYNVFFNPARPNLTHGSMTLSQFRSAYPSLEQHSIYSDPMLVNFAGHDFRLRTSSPAADRGTALASVGSIAFNFDAINISRPQGVSWDAGAYELGSGSATDVQPPSSLSVAVR